MKCNEKLIQLNLSFKPFLIKYLSDKKKNLKIQKKKEKHAKDECVNQCLMSKFLFIPKLIKIDQFLSESDESKSSRMQPFVYARCH